MTHNLFTERLGKFDPNVQNQGRSVLLVLGNCMETVLMAKLLFMSPNVMSNAQALDMGIICAFKAM